ncbi:MAG TPA: alpha-(1-_3)-arabinofuranosyltransferase family protein [Solirubrobacteraceae bacterium]|nr:alpha-(1->3)-arabinofuranosyltransferase family protein [Solirubrobacteraceae bacterium]
MRPLRLGRAGIPLGLAVAAFVLALAQRPGRTITDTKINLNVEPLRFLADVASAWTPTGQLGHVWGGQYAGYLFPMGPFYALGHVLGVGSWVVERLWVGALLALAAWGVVRLLDALLERERGAAHLIAGAIVLLNPYVVVFTNRTSVTLLGYAALPWLLLAVHRGVRDGRRWWWPAAFALLVASTGPGVNAAVTGWVLLGPALLLLYEAAIVRVPWRSAAAFAVRAGALTLAVSLWWIVPALTQARYGVDFLKFTEQPGTIWGTTSVTESLRLMGFWLSYVGVGHTGHLVPYFSDSPTMLFAPVVLVATLLVPALALGGFAWTRRWRYGPFALALLLIGLLVMVSGFPEGTPLRRAATFTYNHVGAVQFLRTTYKAGPLVAFGIALLGGAAGAQLWRRVAARGPLVRVALPAAGVVLLAASAWPLVSGRSLDRQLAWDRIPSAWTRTAHDLDRRLPANTRAVVLPGQLFAFYRWGGTVDAVLPALSKRPVAVRFQVPFSDLHAIDELWTTDGLVEQRRLVPGQLRPLLGQLGAGAVVTATDDNLDRSGAMPPADAAAALAGQGLGSPARAHGPARRFAPSDGIGAPAALPQVRRYDLPAQPGIVRVEPVAPETLVDGSADALAGLGAFGALPQRTPISYAGDRSAAAMRAMAAGGGEVVISDSNRRRVFVPSRLQQNFGYTLSASDSFSADAAVLNPFSGRGIAAQTVAVYDGVRYLHAPYSPGFAQFPEHRPFAAVDGSPGTEWLADSSLEVSRRWLEVGFPAPRDVDHIDVVPYSDERGVVTALEVAGRTFPVHPGLNRLDLHLRHVDALRVRIAGVRQPKVGKGGAGGIAELGIPGLHVREWLRPPTLAEGALAGRDLRRDALTYLFARTTGDDPFLRGPAGAPAQTKQTQDRGSGVIRDRGDAETQVAREIDPPATRAYRADAWVSVAPTAPDDALDALAGTQTAGAAFTSSGRYEGRPGFRASSAFDGDPARPWVGIWVAAQPTWIRAHLPRAGTLRHLRLVAPSGLAVRRPTRVRLSWPGGATAALAVAPDGTVTLPTPVRARDFRLDILAAAFPPGTPRTGRAERAVGIGELSGLPGSSAVSPRGGAVTIPCGGVRVRSAAGGALGLGVRGSRTAFDAGSPLRAASCGAPLSLGAGPGRVFTEGALFRVALLRLRSPAPAGPAAAVGGGRVVDPGREGRGARDGVRVAMNGPAWLVLAESYSPGWRAYCDGRSLGAPQLIDGFANGWRAGRNCRSVQFAFAPNRPVYWAYALSGLAALALLALLVVRRRRAPVPDEARPPPLPDPDPVARWPLGRAVAVGLAAGVVLAFAFSIRSGLLIVPGLALLLWLGIGVRRLALLAGALLAVVVPVLYLVLLPKDEGGFSFTYPVDLIVPHWVGVAAAVLLIVALVRTLAAARNSGH